MKSATVGSVQSIGILLSEAVIPEVNYGILAPQRLKLDMINTQIYSLGESRIYHIILKFLCRLYFLLVLCADVRSSPFPVWATLACLHVDVKHILSPSFSAQSPHSPIIA